MRESFLGGKVRKFWILPKHPRLETVLGTAPSKSAAGVLRREIKERLVKARVVPRDSLP